MYVNFKLGATPKEANFHFGRFYEQAVYWTKKGG